jgi:hypothetical protein
MVPSTGFSERKITYPPGVVVLEAGARRALIRHWRICMMYAQAAIDSILGHILRKKRLTRVSGLIGIIIESSPL